MHDTVEDGSACIYETNYSNCSYCSYCIMHKKDQKMVGGLLLMPSGKLYYCPYFGCNQTSSRRWNMDIHIKRKHGAESPASTNITDSRSVFQGPEPARYYRESIRPGGYSYNHYHPPNSHGADPPPRKEQTAQDRLMATISEINEFMRLMNESRELSMRVSGSYIPQSFFMELMAFNSFQSMHNVRKKKVRLPTGYHVAFCDSCYSGCEFRPVYSQIEFEGATKLTHKCNPKDSFLDQSAEEISRIKSQIQVVLMDHLTKVVDLRIGQGEAYLKLIKVLPSRFFSEEYRRTLKLPTDRSLIEEKDCIEIDPSLEEIHKTQWFSRAIRDIGNSDKLKITRNELNDFLSLARSTFGVFRIKVSDPGAKYYFLIYVAM